VRSRDLALLVALAAMWGAAYTFTKVAVAGVSPAFLGASRLLIAVLVLLAAWPLLGRLAGAGTASIGEMGSFGLREVLARWRSFAVLGATNAAVPYVSIAWGTQYLPSGVAAILNGSVPLFTTVFAALPFFAERRLGPVGIAGILSGLVGVSLIVGGDYGAEATARQTLYGAGAVLVGSSGYALGGLYARRALAGVPTAVNALGQNVAALVLVLPFAALTLPAAPPDARTVSALVLLGTVGTGLAAIVFFTLLDRVGATRTSTVAYLVPVAALVYGILFLGEPLMIRALGGLALILAGVVGVSGAFPRRSGDRKAPSAR